MYYFYSFFDQFNSSISFFTKNISCNNTVFEKRQHITTHELMNRSLVSILFNDILIKSRNFFIHISQSETKKQKKKQDGYYRIYYLNHCRGCWLNNKKYIFINRFNCFLPIYRMSVKRVTL